MRQISVIISTFNAAIYLERTLSSLTFQSMPPSKFEVIVTDDGSTDSTEFICQLFESNLKLKYYRQQHLGFRLSSLRNLALEKASNEVIVQLDADMILSEELLETYSQWFEQHENIAIIGGRRFIDPSAFPSRLTVDDYHALINLPTIKSSSNWFMKEDRRNAEFEKFSDHPMPFNLFHGCNVAFQKSNAVAAGLYDTDFNFHWGYEDIEFGYRLWNSGVSLIADSNALCFHQENNITSFETKVKDDLINFNKACERIPGYREFKTKLNSHDRLPWW